MKTSHVLNILSVLSVVFLTLAACGPSPEQQTAMTSTAMTALAALWTATPTIIPTATQVPTSTPAPTQTTIPTPTPTLTPTQSQLLAWEQVNAPDITYYRQDITSLQVFKGELYAASSNWNSQSDTALYHSTDGAHWNKIDSLSVECAWFHFGTFKDMLYAGGGCSLGILWRSSDGKNWEVISPDGFGDPTNQVVGLLYEFNGMLYASTYNGTSGAQIWRSSSGDPGTWNKVFSNENPIVMSVNSFYSFGGKLYATFGVLHETAMIQVWRSEDGVKWEEVDNGFDQITNGINLWGTSNMIDFKGVLYLGTSGGMNGGQLYRLENGASWIKVFDDGMGDADNFGVESLIIFNSDLYMVLDNEAGITVWRSSDAQKWDQVSEPGFGDPSNNQQTQGGTSVTIFNNQLYIGTDPFADENGTGQIWRTGNP